MEILKIIAYIVIFYYAWAFIMEMLTLSENVKKLLKLTKQTKQQE